jgi:ribose transport system substrate-binding protein
MIAALLALPACGNKGGSGYSSPKSPAGAVKVAFISNNPYEFWTIARRGAEQAVRELKEKEKIDVDLEFHMPARGTAAEQRAIIEDLLTKGVKGIAISVNDAANQADYYNELADKVPLITQDSDLPQGSKRLCYIGTNNVEAGKAAGELVKKVCPEGGKYVIYVGKLDVQNAQERRQGVIEVLSKGADGKEGKFNLLNTMTDDAKSEKCKSNVEDTLVKYPDVRCLVGLWAYNPPAMLAALKEKPDLLGKVAIVGFDENEETLQGIKEGHIYGTIVQQPFEFGRQSIIMLAKIAKGDKSMIPKDGILYVPHKVITKDNVEQFHSELKKLKAAPSN